MTTIVFGAGLAVFLDGDSTPTYRLCKTDNWRPAKEDMSWRVEDEDTRRVVDEYHPAKPRHAGRATSARPPQGVLMTNRKASE